MGSQHPAHPTAILLLPPLALSLLLTLTLPKQGTEDVWEWVTEVAIVGGIMVNRKSGGDFFQPLSFELRTQVRFEG